MKYYVTCCITHPQYTPTTATGMVEARTRRDLEGRLAGFRMVEYAWAKRREAKTPERKQFLFHESNLLVVRFCQEKCSQEEEKVIDEFRARYQNISTRSPRHSQGAR